MTGIELIVKERQEQIQKHDRTVEHDVAVNKDEQLVDAMLLIIASSTDDNNLVVQESPQGWNGEVWQNILSKPWKERLAVLGAFAAAEIDRLNYIENDN